MFKYSKVFKCNNRFEFKSHVTKLLDKRSFDIHENESKNTNTLTQFL